MAEWIACECQLPKVDMEDILCRSAEVLLFSRQAGVAVGYLQDSNFGLEDERCLEWVLSGRDGYKAGEVTHWMPLPEMPHA